MKIKHKFYLGLLLIVIGIITNSVYYYHYFQGYIITGYLGIFIRASASVLFIILYFVVGGWLVYRYRLLYWTD